MFVETDEVKGPWADLYDNERYTSNDTWWVDYHVTGLSGPDPWWDEDSFWDAPLTTISRDKIGDWAQAIKHEVIKYVFFFSVEDPDSEEWDTGEWYDVYYLAIAGTLGAATAEAMAPHIDDFDEDDEDD